MKLTLYILVVAMLTTALTGCSNSEKSDSITKESNSYIAEEFPDEGGEPFSEFNLSSSEITSICEKLSNINSIENTQIFLPKNASAVYRYTEFPPNIIDMKASYNEFLELFKAFFPEHQFNKDALVFYDREEGVDKKFFDYENELISGKFGRVSLKYLEDSSNEWNNRAYMYTAYPAGYGLTDVNKGKTASIVNLPLSGFDPLDSDSLEFIAEYSPESTQKIKLLDGEIAINEAVAFYEDYVNNQIPYPVESNCRTAVCGVEVYRVSDDVCGIAFNTTMELQNVPYDHIKNGTVQSNIDSSPIMGQGFMIETTDVDYIRGYYRRTDAQNIEAHKNIIGCTDALKTVSRNLTNEVVFDLRKIEFVYSRFFTLTSEGYIDIEKYTDEVIPEWKITLYNPNDDYLYVCYVEALDKQKFRYDVRLKPYDDAE